MDHVDRFECVCLQTPLIECCVYLVIESLVLVYIFMTAIPQWEIVYISCLGS